MRLVAALLALGCAHAALRLDLEQTIETVLARKSAEPLWVESTHAQALAEFEQACAGKLARTPPHPNAAAFRGIVERLLAPSGRRVIEVLYLECGASFSAVTLAAIVLANSSWLSRASEDELWAVAAHEMAHRPSDFSRRVVIGLHIPGLDRATRASLATDLEVKADAGAVALLRAAGRDPVSLRRFLEKENRAAYSEQLKQRLAALGR